YADRGARYRAAYGWLALLAAEAVLLWWIGALPRSEWHTPLESWPLRSPPTPLVGRLVCAAAFAAAVWRAWPEFKPIPVGNAGAIATFFLAAEWAGSSGAYALFMAVSGLVLIIGLLQESHQRGLRELLPGLTGRRELCGGL